MHEYEQTGWEYSGTIGDFMHLIRWAFVFQSLGTEENILDIIENAEKVRNIALSKGMTISCCAGRTLESIHRSADK